MSEESHDILDGLNQIASAANDLREVLFDSFQTVTADEESNIPSSIKSLSDSIDYAARQIGQGGEYGPGALEFIGMQIKEHGESVSSSVSEIAGAINNLAEAIREMGRK